MSASRLRQSAHRTSDRTISTATSWRASTFAYDILATTSRRIAPSPRRRIVPRSRDTRPLTRSNGADAADGLPSCSTATIRPISRPAIDRLVGSPRRRRPGSCSGRRSAAGSGARRCAPTPCRTPRSPRVAARRRPRTRTRSPARMASPIDGPSTSSQRGPRARLRRSTLATAAPRSSTLRAAGLVRFVLRGDEYGRTGMPRARRRVISMAGVADRASMPATSPVAGASTPCSAPCRGHRRRAGRRGARSGPRRPTPPATHRTCGSPTSRCGSRPTGVVTRHDSGWSIRRRRRGDHQRRRTGPRRRSAARLPPQRAARARRRPRRPRSPRPARRGVRPRTTAVVVLGDTGAGKSTLAIGALRAGWSVLTDDIAWLPRRRPAST